MLIGYNNLRRVLWGYALSVAFWLPLSQLVGWQTYLTERKEHLPVLLQILLLLFAVRYLTVALLTPPIFFCVNRWPISGTVIHRTAAYALGYLPFSVAFAAIRWSLLPPWLDETMSWGPRTLGTLVELTYDTFADVFLLYLGVVFAAHAYTYFARSRRQEIERLQLRQSLAQSELQALRAQLHPHFLFNTLQGVSTLIGRDPAAAQRMLLALAALLRTVLKHKAVDLISLREELAFVREYLALEHMRLGARLTVRWQIAPEANDALVPQLLLQPLMENAIVHGIASAREGGWIELNASVIRGQLHMRISNSVAAPSESGLRVGLANVQARLKYLYGDDARFEFQLHAEAGLAVASLTLPALSEGNAEKGDLLAIE